MEDARVRRTADRPTWHPPNSGDLLSEAAVRPSDPPPSQKALGERRKAPTLSQNCSHANSRGRHRVCNQEKRIPSEAPVLSLGLPRGPLTWDRPSPASVCVCVGASTCRGSRLRPCHLREQSPNSTPVTRSKPLQVGPLEAQRGKAVCPKSHSERGWGGSELELQGLLTTSRPGTPTPHCAFPLPK